MTLRHFAGGSILLAVGGLLFAPIAERHGWLLVGGVAAASVVFTAAVACAINLLAED